MHIERKKEVITNACERSRMREGGKKAQRSGSTRRKEWSAFQP
jgi:hypothetical protein